MSGDFVMATVNESDPLLGRVLDGRYQITNKVDRGGMATVYLATDTRLTRRVAVKVMHDSLGGDADFVARFDREARAAAGLIHPNVVSVFDQGMDRGRPYIVMEYVEGETLRKLIVREAPVAAQRAVELLIPVVSAVAAAHDKGIMHRDLKPENVLISNRNQLKVADFGLARAVTSNTVTSAGTVIGSVSYLAPELVTDGKADTRADIYALGVILYELLTGRKPHTGESPIQVAYSHVHKDIEPPSAAAPSQAVPDYLDAIVLKCVNREIEARPRDATVLLDYLLKARADLAAGKANDPQLAAWISEGSTEAADQLTMQVPLLADGQASDRDNTISDTATIPVIEADASGNEPSLLATAMPAVQTAQPLVAKQRKRRRTGLTVFLILLILAVLLGFTGWYLFKGRYVEVPDFANLSQTKAEALAMKTGIKIVFENAYSEDIPAGQVIETIPTVNEPIERGGTLQAFLSKGQERYEVPKLTGMTLNEANAALTKAHLQIGVVTEDWDDKAAFGTVVSSSVKAAKLVKPLTVVDLVVSKGPQPVPIVSFAGKPFDEAKQFYEAAGLKVKKAEQLYDDEIAKGDVIEQTPNEGELHRGDTISFTVSKGPELVEVPKVRGSLKAAAVERLTDAGFKVEISNQVNFPLGFVNGSNPSAGKKAPKGSTVTLYIV
ncbi:MAG: Stk1 family PASTA domain-containing Ser/Thr kinase [Propionibacteriaceae bacterium]|jgi:serine/threonine-protein kinase|nr:Stk1 family PASTA domain-containing Ser/Thr kinase [Propionibacteriaceae bacterium]